MKTREYLREFKKDIQDNFKEIKHFKDLKKQIPNLLTSSRGISPIVIIPLAIFGYITSVLVAGVIFALTDLFDGMFARKFNCQTKLGEKLDPICDKILAITIGIPMIFLNFGLIINVILEGVIASINIKSTLKENNPTSNKLGKFKTFLLSTSLLVVYACSILNLNILYAYLSIGVTGLFQTLAAVKYSKIDKQKDLKKKEIREEITEPIIEEDKEYSISDIIYYEDLQQHFTEEKVKTLVKRR